MGGYSAGRGIRGQLGKVLPLFVSRLRGSLAGERKPVIPRRDKVGQLGGV